jgi:hypothetical protein
MYCFTFENPAFSLSLTRYLYRYHEATMAGDVIEQIKAYIQEILRLALDVKGRCKGDRVVSSVVG